MPDVQLTPTSYVVLGLVAGHGSATSYEMKQLVNISIGCFWSFPHSQLYAEPVRLAEHGLLVEEQEPGGRRRRRYRITASGQAVLDTWLAEPTSEGTEIRDLGLLKLFFGQLSSKDDLVALAEAKRKGHVDELARLQALDGDIHGLASEAERATLDLGMRWEQLAIDFWAEIAADPPTGPTPR